MPGEALEVTEHGLTVTHATGALPATVNPEALLATAIEKGVGIETLERLLALREKLNAENARAAFFQALAGFQSECPIIPKTKTAKIEGSRGSYTYSYAPLEVIVARVQPLLQKWGLSAVFDTVVTDVALQSVCTVHHVAGHHEASSFQVPIDKAARMNDAQKVASASTYAKRYAYCNALGILTGDDDDDAHSAGPTVTGGPVQSFTAPRRKSEPAPATEQDAVDIFNAPPSDEDLNALDRAADAAVSGEAPARAPAQLPLPAAPDDAISVPRHNRVYKLIHEALKAAGQPDTTESMEAVTAALDALVLKHCDRVKWQHVSFKGPKDDTPYDRMCRAIPEIVARLGRKAHARLVRR